VRGALDRAEGALADDREAVADRRARADAAAERLAEVVDGYV
jgi:hypothetical protein